MQKIKGVLVALILALPLVLGIHINEIMYNPVGDDNNKEFVEIMGTDNLTDYTVGDLAGNDSLELVKFVPRSFSLIVEEGFNHSNINCTIYSVGATIGNNLNNAEDTVFLYYNNILVDFVGYDGSLANSNDYSLSLVNGSWQESCELGGSPGRANCVPVNENFNESLNETFNETINASETNVSEHSQVNETNNTTSNANETQEENETSTGLKLEIIIPEILYLGSTYTSLFRISNLDHVSGQEDAIFVMVKYNVSENNSNNSLIKEDYFNKTINYYSSSNTGKLFFEETGNYTLCGSIVNKTISVCREFAVINPLGIPCIITLNLSTDKDLYVNNEKVKIKNIISNNSFPFIIEYWVEDLFGNEVKKKYTTSNTNQKTYTPKIVEKDRVFLVKNRLVFVACNNSNNITGKEKMIIIKKEEASIGRDDETDSGINIDYVYVPRTGTLLFGDDFNVKLSIHKGDTSKSVVSVFVAKDKERVSEETKFYLNKKNYDYNITVKVFLKPNCDNKFIDGSYDVIVEGLDKRAGKEIEIKDNKKGVCKQAEADEAGEIISFYTRAKKWNKNINLYANIKGEGEYKAILHSKIGEQNQTVALNSSRKITFIAKPEPGTNLFILELRKESLVIDTKALIAELEGGEEKISIEQETLGLYNETSKEKNKSANYSSHSLAPVTGSVVFESNNVKIKKYVPYLLAFVLLLITFAFLFSKRR